MKRGGLMLAGHAEPRCGRQAFRRRSANKKPISAQSACSDVTAATMWPTTHVANDLRDALNWTVLVERLLRGRLGLVMNTSQWTTSSSGDRATRCVGDCC